MRDRLRDKKWFPYTVAACIAVTFYVVLTHMGAITGAALTFLGYFKTIFLGAVIAYIMNPMAKLLRKTAFKGVHSDKLAWNISIGASVVILLLMLGFLLRALIPQLINSCMMLLSNLDGYLDSLQELMNRWPRSDAIRIDQIFSSSGDLVKNLQSYFSTHAGSVVNASAEAGKSIVVWIIALVFSVYMLASKDRIKKIFEDLLSSLMSEKRYDEMIRFLSRCDKIFVGYIVASLVDAVIIGLSTAVFMSIFGMEYVGLISVVVAVTNLIPTFGPVIGGAAGGLILLLVKPVHALIFLIFMLVIKVIDPYFIKPKLFGSTLGVSGLLILMSVIVCGSMFGVVGLLIGIPLAAILEAVYKEAVMPALERRKAARKG